VILHVNTKLDKEVFLKKETKRIIKEIHVKGENKEQHRTNLELQGMRWLFEKKTRGVGGQELFFPYLRKRFQ